MDRELLRLILNYEFYKENKNSILDTMFPSNLQGLFEIIVKTHEKLQRNLNITEVKALYKANNPTATKASLDVICSILDQLPTEVSDEVAKEVLRKAYITELGRRITDLSIKVINGETSKISEIRQILEKAEAGRFSEFEGLEAVSAELEDILASVSTTTKWSFNISQLKEVAVGVGPGIFKAAFGRVETGKTAYGISLMAAPGGFAEQGAICHYFCNEEPAQRSQLRAVMAYTGMDLQSILLDTVKAKKIYERVKNNIKFFECKGMTAVEIEHHINHFKPDVFLIDQLDKVSIDGSFAREDERLGALYAYTRDICVRQECAGIALSQANADAEGKAYLATTNMSLARTSKAAECDILIGIGRTPDAENNGRVLNVIKNKISGNHKQVVCIIRPEISRYTD